MYSEQLLHCSTIYFMVFLDSIFFLLLRFPSKKKKKTYSQHRLFSKKKKKKKTIRRSARRKYLAWRSLSFNVKSFSNYKLFDLQVLLDSINNYNILYIIRNRIRSVSLWKRWIVFTCGSRIIPHRWSSRRTMKMLAARRHFVRLCCWLN